MPAFGGGCFSSGYGSGIPWIACESRPWFGEVSASPDGTAAAGNRREESGPGTGDLPELAAANAIRVFGNDNRSVKVPKSPLGGDSQPKPRTTVAARLSFLSLRGQRCFLELGYSHGLVDTIDPRHSYFEVDARSRQVRLCGGILL